MPDIDLSRAQWQKSSYSGNSGNCVEVAQLGGVVAVRDSKDAKESGLVVSRAEWCILVQSIKAAR